MFCDCDVMFLIFQLCRFVQLQSIVEVKLGDVLPVVVQKVTDKLRSYKIPQPNIILGNILAILEWEKSTKSLSERSGSPARSSFTSLF